MAPQIEYIVYLYLKSVNTGEGLLMARSVVINTGSSILINEGEMILHDIEDFRNNPIYRLKLNFAGYKLTHEEYLKYRPE